MALTYTTWKETLATMLATDPTNTDFLTVLPACADYADGRLYRELDMMVANVRDGSSSTSASNRNFNLPTGVGTFLIVDDINIITPAATAPDSGTRRRLTPASLSVLDWTWPSVTGSGVPEFWAYVTQDTASSPAQNQIAFGPWPDAAYRVEVIGKIQPPVLSVSNASTYLTANLPDLYLAASMVFMTGYQKNFGAQADDPKMAQSWEGQYQLLKASAATQEARKRFGGASWTAKALEPTAQPQRG